MVTFIAAALIIASLVVVLIVSPNVFKEDETDPIMWSLPHGHG